MRGKDSGSEHENETAWARREADAESSATPPTPPPSFGQTPPPGAGQPPADGGTAWAPDAAGAADQPYPVRFGLPGGLRAPEPPADDPESTNSFRAVPAYGPPPGDAGLPAPRHPGDESPALPAYGPPAWQPPAPAAPSWQPPHDPGAGGWAPPAPGGAHWAPAAPGAQPDPNAYPAPQPHQQPSWQPVQGAGDPAYPQTPPPPGPQQPVYDPGPQPWQPPMEGANPAWQPPAAPGPQAWPPQGPGTPPWEPPAGPPPPPSWQQQPGVPGPQPWPAPGTAPGPVSWPSPGAGEPVAPGAFGASPSPYETGPQGQTAPAAYAPDQQNAGGPWAPQPGMPPVAGWGPAPGQAPAAEAYQGGAPQIDPANPGAEPARPPEPGEATAWPPRLPGEPYPQGEAPAGSSWPPADAYRNEPAATRVLEAPAGDPPGAGEPGGTPGAELVPVGTPQDTAAPTGEQPGGAGGDSHETRRMSVDGTTQPLPQPEEPLHTPDQTPDAPGQAAGDAPSGTDASSGTSQTPGETPAATASPSPSESHSASEASPADVPPSAAPSGAASSDTPPTEPSTSGGGTDSPNPNSGQMATTSPTTGSPSQPTGETPFAFTPVKPARAGKPAPPPGFGPPPSTPASNLPALPTPTDPPSSGGKITRILMAAGAVVVVGAIGTAAYFAYSGDSDGSRAAPTAAATTAPAVEEPQPSQTAASAILDSEQTDPKTLKAEEAFPDEKVTLDGRTYRRVKIDVTDDCEKAATGAFAKALAEQQCRRVLRATYVDGKRQYAVTAGIAVLPGKTEALAVNQTKDLNSNVWFRGLNGDKASGADKVSISGGYATGMVWGRYIVFSYATYADGHNPDANDTTLGPISSAFRDNMAKVIEKRASR